MEYISLEVKIPNSMLQNFQNEIYQFFITLPHEVNDICDYPEYIKYHLIISDNNLSSYIEEKLDNYTDYKLQYNILTYSQESEFPSSVRINKRGKKIITKKQVKTLFL